MDRIRQLIAIARRRQQLRVFVADFGLAKLIRPGSDLTQSHRALGTPHYLAPEVAATHAGRARASPMTRNASSPALTRTAPTCANGTLR